jgi:hypothetical protein
MKDQSHAHGSDWKISGTPLVATPDCASIHLLLGPPLAGRLVAAGVDRHVRGREKASDHAPA